MASGASMGCGERIPTELLPARWPWLLVFASSSHWRGLTARRSAVIGRVPEAPQVLMCEQGLVPTALQAINLEFVIPQEWIKD